MRKLITLVLVSLSLCFTASSAWAATRLGESCDLAVTGASDSSGFLQFDAALRAALAKHDTAAFAKLADFPLRVNDANGRHETFKDATALQKRLDGASLQALEKAVAASPVSRLFCNDNGVMYGDGAIWANLAGVGKAQPFRITALNLPASVATSPAAPPLGFNVDVTLTPKAAQRLKATHEGITVSASYYGDPKPGDEKHADEVGQIDLGNEQVMIPGQPGPVHITGKQVKRDRLRWIKGGVKVNVNVYSSRLSGPDNILNCDFIDGDVAAVVKQQPITLRCGLITEHPDTKLKP